MRWLIITAIIIGMQGLNFGLAKSLHWLVRPWWSVGFLPVAIAVFILSNALFATLFIGQFRLAIGWLSVLWLWSLSAVISFGLIYGLHKAGVVSLVPERLLAVASFGVVLGFAVHNAYNPTVRHLAIQVDKPMPAPVRLAVASDLHLGKMFGKRELALLETLMTTHKVDLLLMPGDIMDDDTEQFEKLEMADALQRAMTAPRFGTVATLGNHDLYRTHAYNSITQAIIDGGAILLNDDSTTLTLEKDGKTSTLAIIGRYDDHHETRLPTATLLKNVDTRLPVVLVDHRPSDIDTHATLPIDLQVSGHTHNGQVFPANFIVKAINRVGYGYEKINDTHFVVSSGFGFWGVPFRLGSRSEIWVIDLVGKDSPTL